MRTDRWILVNFLLCMLFFRYSAAAPPHGCDGIDGSSVTIAFEWRGLPQVDGNDTPVIVNINGDDWTIQPFFPGFSLLENKSHIVYGSNFYNSGIAHMPTFSVAGSVTIPVFMVDWSDFDPVTEESNHNNPSSTFPEYVQRTPAELEVYLNSPHGPSGYFEECSGGLLSVSFEVFGWIESSSSAYLKDKEPYYYYESPPESGNWFHRKTDFAKDVLRAAVAEFGVDLTQYDSDNNLVLDGFVIVYEGHAGKLAGTNMSWTNTSYYTHLNTPALNNVASLVDTNDPYFDLFSHQQILYSRYCNIPEQTSLGDFTSVATWTHELGHLWLGYRDYCYPPTSLGVYGMSAGGGSPNPMHPSAMEKYLFAHWLAPEEILEDATYFVRNHHLVNPAAYDANEVYLYKIIIDEDPNHYLLLENRHFLPEANGGSYFNLELPWESSTAPESGLIIFEVNLNSPDCDQLRMLIPNRLPPETTNYTNFNVGAFQPGDILNYTTVAGRIVIDEITSPGEIVSFRFRRESSVNL